jgi:hypothetical protein
METLIELRQHRKRINTSIEEDQQSLKTRL